MLFSKCGKANEPSRLTAGGREMQNDMITAKQTLRLIAWLENEGITAEKILECLKQTLGAENEKTA